MANAQFKFELGETVKDSVTGVEGVILTRLEHLTGCLQYTIQPSALDKDGKIRESYYLDEGRLSQVSNVKRVVLDQGAPNGGPQRPVTSRSPRRTL